jgi:hypothetical protein
VQESDFEYFAAVYSAREDGLKAKVDRMMRLLEP